jgi:glycosyl transferase, family 25
LNLPSPITRSLEQHFEKILVVSLPRFTERHNNLEERLKGLRFEYFWGADKLQLDEEKVRGDGTYDEKSARRLQRQGKPLNMGEIACSLSHRAVYAKMVEKGWDKILILEDDVLPVFPNIESIPAALAELPADWELVYLGYLKHEKVTPGLKIKQLFYRVLSGLGGMKWSPGMVKNLLPKPYSKHLKKAGFHDCTHAYAITQSAARKLLAAQTPVVYRADDLLSAMVLKGELKAFVTEPRFFDQEAFHNAALGSEIRPEK